jgi:23S rRNA pseudouridine2457 synthase
MSTGLVYIAFYKPDGVLTAFTDPEGRETLKAYIDVPDVYPAGRLDMDSEGLLFLTNDGSLAHRMTDPAFEHPKTYLVQVEGIPQKENLAQLEQGVVIKGRRTRRCQVIVVPEPALAPRPRPVTPHGPTTWLRIVLREGMKRQIRHMTAVVGLPTLRLVRIAMGSVSLNELQPGEWRYLTPAELAALKNMLVAPPGRNLPAAGVKLPREQQTAGRRKVPTAGETPVKSPGNVRGSRYQNGSRRRSGR